MVRDKQLISFNGEIVRSAAPILALRFIGENIDLLLFLYEGEKRFNIINDEPLETVLGPILTLVLIVRQPTIIL